MSMRLSLLCVVFFVGCSSPRQQPTIYGDTNNQPPIVLSFSESKYIPEAGCFIDYTDNILSWHYHGRERDAEPEEVAFFLLEQEVTLARLVGGEEDILAKLIEARDALKQKYTPLFQRLAAEDQERNELRIKQLISDAKKQNNSSKASTINH